MTTVALAIAWLVISPTAGATAPLGPAASGTRPGAATVSRSLPSRAAAPTLSAQAGSVLVLSHSVRRACPPAATACADLTGHITWLQSDGHVTYGPVRMEPGSPSDPTPKGIFHVAWKAGPNYISTSYDVPIPYAVFFAPGGIAFHAGSLTHSSHGCIHLSRDDARYYNDHLPVGAEVAVFRPGSPAEQGPVRR